ncbi:GRB2-related adapter protein-like [Cynoglossus semilaevis]|uniref:GRB2-related adapter protein-like n=1 Tax=Cynoglossus semilaevis TaxID=244447 RepID=UPI0007DCAFEE|nr:GRB2-related adapter protein-like [Cynoglossus semilaevis]
MESVALFSFSPSEDDELCFHKGDIIKVIETEDDSGWLTAEIQGKRGYVPENHVSLLPQRWFVGQITRLEAEQRLWWQVTGVFLVRGSESAPGEFSVSVSYGDRVEHFRVLEKGGQYCIWDKSFRSLNRLVDFYRSHSIDVEEVVYLRDPPLSPHPPSQPGSGSGSNPYPNPYLSSSQEFTPSGRVYAQPERDTLSGKRLVARALCDYNPPQTTHLHLLRGDVIDVLDCSGPQTWRGRCRGRVGFFSPEFVQIYYH